MRSTWRDLWLGIRHARTVDGDPYVVNRADSRAQVRRMQAASRPSRRANSGERTRRAHQPYGGSLWTTGNHGPAPATSSRYAPLAVIADDLAATAAGDLLEASAEHADTDVSIVPDLIVTALNAPHGPTVAGATLAA